MMDCNGRRNRGFTSAAKVRKYAEPKIQTAQLGVVGPYGSPAIPCPICNRPAWSLNDGTLFGHVRVERGFGDAGFPDCCEVRRKDMADRGSVAA